MNTSSPLRLLAVLSLALGVSAPAASAATFNLSFTADGSSRWYEYFSDSFAQLDRGFGGNPALDGFYSISALPTFTQIGTGADVFPTEAAFANIGSLAFADTFTGSGLETAAITGLTLNFSPFVADDDNITAAGYTTGLSAVSGNVTLFNGAVTAINLTSTITFTYDFSGFGAGPLPYSGSFVITGQSFDLYVDHAYTAFAPNDLRYVWDVTGTVNDLATAAIPEPSATAALAAGAALAIALIRRRRPQPL
jgi:hypothetical protein